MPIETNLNQSPFFDDFSEDKNFHRVLFRPGYAVQARELTQLQTILQNQIERGFNEVLKDGTVVTGVPIHDEFVQYVKLRDRDANNRIVLTTDFYNSGILANATVTGTTSGVEGLLVDVIDGSEAAAADGSGGNFTIYVQYTNSGANNTTQSFTDNEVVTVRSRAGVFKVAANTVASSATGKGFRASVGDGIIYHKGSFIRVDPQSTIVDKYSTTPTRYLGFETAETTVDSNEDASLLDNATGATNFAAPGAERLKLSPTLTSRIPATANTSTFVTIAKFEEGNLVKELTKTQYSDLGKYVGNIFYETNGDYITKPFHFRIREHFKSANNLGRYANTTVRAGSISRSRLVCEVEPGIGYVKGNRSEYSSSIFRTFRKATASETKDARTLSVSYGNYVIVDEVSGHWDIRNLGTVSLRSVAANSITNRTYGTTSAPGAQIGTAKVRGFEIHSGTPGTPTAQYRLYLFDISMVAGQKFASVRTLYYNWASQTDALADCVLESSEAKLKETNINKLIFPFAQKGTKTLKDADDNVDTQFVTRRKVTLTFSGTNNRSATLSVGNTATGGSETFNDSVTSAADRKKFIVVAKQAVSTVNLTGTASSSGTTVTGSGTAFTSQLAVGDIILSDSQTRRVTAIASATSLTTDTAFSGALSGDTFVKHYPAGHIFDFSADGGSSADDSSTQRTIHVGGENIATSSWKGEVYYNLLRSAAVQEAKTINKGRYVHINVGLLGGANGGNTGPWSLGVPDVHKIKNVYRGSNTAVTTADTNVTREFILNTGQTESFYGTSKLALRPTNQLSTAISAVDGLLIEFDHFTTDTSSGKGFFSVDSYPIDDLHVGNTASITTQEIPLIEMEGTGTKYDLRDSVDFRPRLANTCSPTTTGTAAGAPSNPASLTSVTVDANFGSYIPTPDENFQADVQYYLNRKDNVVLTADGNIIIDIGVAAERARAPFDNPEGMVLATLDIPYYPSLSSHVAKQFNRRDLEVKLTVRNNRRYTMKDIRGIEGRIKNLEYYVSLNALESSAQNKQIFNATGQNRFKNGVFVDNFDGHNNADTSARGYRAAIDSGRSHLRPVFKRKDISMSLSTTLANTAIRKTGDLITLAYSDVELIEQKKATSLRNPVQEITALWEGTITLSPEIDNTPDVTTLPDIQVDFDGMYDAVSNLTNVLNDEGVLFGEWQTTAESVTSSGPTRSDHGRGNLNYYTDTIQQQQTLTGTQLQVSPSKETFEIGNFVENVAVRDYMRPREINFTATGLKPSTRVYAFFDDEVVSPFCTPTTSAFANTAPQGANLVTDSTGTLYGKFAIPNNTNLKFRVGERKFQLLDIANTQTQSALVTTEASATYVSTPLDVIQRGSSINVTTPVVTGSTVVQTRTNTSTRSRVVAIAHPVARRNDWHDYSDDGGDEGAGDDEGGGGGGGDGDDPGGADGPG